MTSTCGNWKDAYAEWLRASGRQHSRAGLAAAFEAGWAAREGYEPVESGRANVALDVLREYGDIDGAHHKQWVIDKVESILSGKPPKRRGIAP